MKFIAAILAFAVIAQAQTSRGTVTGTVLDATGAAVAGAHVTLTGVDTGARLSSQSNGNGVYRFDAVDLGMYDLEVTHSGFRTYAAHGIAVEANRVISTDPKLEVGVAETRIEVSAESSDWVVGTGFPNASTVGRNTLRTGGTNNFDLNLTKSIPLGETRRLEVRWEALNAFHHPQFINVPQRNVLSAPRGQFLNRDFTDSGIRSMWLQVKLAF